MSKAAASTLDAESAHDHLPEGWTWVTAGDVVASSRNALAIGPFGSSLKVVDYRENGVPLVFVRDVRAEVFGGPSTKFVSEEKAKQLSAHVVRPGDLLVTKMGDPPGDTAVYPDDRPPGIVTADCIKLTPNADLVSVGYLKYCLRAEPARSEVLEQTMGVAQQKLSLARFREIRFPLPPLREQRRIVERLDALLRHVNAAREHLDRVPGILKRFRQAVLAAAYDGGLNEVLSLSSRSRLGGCTGRIQENLGSYASSMTNGLSRRPRGTESGPVVLRLADVSEGRIDLRHPRHGSLSPDELDRYRLSKGDLLFVRVNGSLEIVGRCVPVEATNEEPLCFNDHLIRVRVNQNELLPEYAAIVSNSPAARVFLEYGAVSTAGQHTINQKLLGELPIPVPSISEQQEIVRMVRALLDLADSIEAHVTRASARAEKLTHAILAKAFRGELVPTEAELARREGRDFEPASELLKRIQADAEKIQPTRKRASIRKPLTR